MLMFAPEEWSEMKEREHILHVFSHLGSSLVHYGIKLLHASLIDL